VPGLRPPRVEARGNAAVAGSVRAEMHEQARASGLIIAAAALVVFPAWSGFDALLEPGLAQSFLVARLAGLVPIALAGWLLWRRPLGRRRPELLSVAILVVVQAVVVWMIPQVRNVEPYVLGLSVALLVAGCLLATHPRWTAGLVGATWLALAGAVVLAPTPMPVRALAIAGFYLATASLVAVVVHVHRYRLAVRELTVRLRLEQEQNRTAVLLAKLQRLSQEDPLTSLANRRRWDAELETACAQARHRGTSVAVILLDLDHFKQVNDTHGHERGDAVLRDVAYEMRKALRSFELMYRIGGEEFIVLLPGLPVTDAVEIAERVRRAVEISRPGDLELTVSAGVATGSGHEVTYERLFRAADSALLEAKREGRNRVRAAAEGIPLVPVPDVRALVGDETAARVS
jgi:diguanylate cyclase (GGDEF)-like protein